MSCPKPDKIKHRSQAAAQNALRSLREAKPTGPDLMTYRCGDHWHVGHSRVSFEKRLRRALRRKDK